MLRVERNTNSNEDKRGIGKRAKSEATREGEAVVLADHSTEGQEKRRP